MNTTDIRVLQAEELDLIGGGERNTAYIKLSTAHIEGKGDLVYGSIQINGYALPVAQWHPK